MSRSASLLPESSLRVRKATGEPLANMVFVVREGVGVNFCEAVDITIYSDASVREHFGAIYPNVRFFKCQEAGHYSMLEAPVITASEIEKFILSASRWPSSDLREGAS
jgi:hypothetical protein